MAYEQPRSYDMLEYADMLTLAIASMGGSFTIDLHDVMSLGGKELIIEVRQDPAVLVIRVEENK